MTKKRSLFNLADPLRTTVNSKTYGRHTRASRGTKSKVEVNETLKAHNLLLTSANIPAVLVKKAIDSYRDGLPAGQLWQFLVGMFKVQLKMMLPLNVDKLMFRDISKEYTFSRLVRQGFKQAITADRSMIRVDIEKLNPQFRRKAIDGYQVEVIAIFFDFDRMETTSDSVSGQIVSLRHDQVLNFELNTGKPGDRYLICLKLTGCIGGEIQTDHSSKCMCIIETGTVGEHGLEKSGLEWM